VSNPLLDQFQWSIVVHTLTQFRLYNSNSLNTSSDYNKIWTLSGERLNLFVIVNILFLVRLRLLQHKSNYVIGIFWYIVYLTLATKDLNIKTLLDFTIQTIADKIKSKTPEEVHTFFKVKNTFISKEEEIRLKFFIY